MEFQKLFFLPSCTASAVFDLEEEANAEFKVKFCKNTFLKEASVCLRKDIKFEYQLEMRVGQE